MQKQYELSDPKSQFNKASWDEPIFIVRANDPLAPMLVRHWVTMSQGLQPNAKHVEALACAEQMAAWRNAAYPEPKETA